MKNREIRFECDPGLDHIEILVRGPAEDEDVQALIKQLRKETPSSLTVFDDDGAIRSIETEEIVLVSVMGKLVNIITENGNWYTRRSLQTLEEMMDERLFLRVSRYELVNLEKVLRYDFTVAGTLRLELKGGMETWASRRCIPTIRKRLQGKE